jgi:Transcriptional regulator, AbiEi antitoxin
MIRLVAAPEPAFRRNPSARKRACDEVLALGDERRNLSSGAHDCDEILVGDEAIAALAARQCGVVTIAQLAAAGLNRNAVAHRVANGRLTPLHRGVYQVGPIAAPRTREMAAVLATGGVLSHHSAAAIWGIRPPHDGDVHITTTSTARSREASVSTAPPPSLRQFTTACRSRRPHAPSTISRPFSPATSSSARSRRPRSASSSRATSCGRRSEAPTSRGSRALKESGGCSRSFARRSSRCR